MILLDTNVVSEVMRPSPDPNVMGWFGGLTGEAVGVSVITIAEIEYGLARLPDGARRRMLSARFSDLTGPQSGLSVFALDDVAAAEAGRLKAACEAEGRSAAFADMMIAATAITADAALATRNEKDFEGLPFDVVNPWTTDERRV